MRFRPDKHRLPVYDRSGVLLVNKPKDWTSHDVVAFIRSRFNAAKCGHCGTLDPEKVGELLGFFQLSSGISGYGLNLESDTLIDGENDRTHLLSSLGCAGAGEPTNDEN